MTGRRRRSSSFPPFNSLQTTAALVLLATFLAVVAGLPTSDIDDVRVASPGDGDVIGTIDAVASSTAPETKKSSSDDSGLKDKKKSRLGRRKKETSVVKQPVSSENVIRPLENFADRFMKSETVGVVDNIAAQAIEAFARLVDGAGLLMVDIIDSLPDTIDRVADTVDGMVKTADDIGRNVAVVVTAPARIVLTGLNPNYNSTLTRRKASDISNNEVDNDRSPSHKNGTEKSLDDGGNRLRSSRRRQDGRSSRQRSSQGRQQSLFSDIFNQRRQQTPTDRSNLLSNLLNRNNSSPSNLQKLLSRSMEDFNNGSNVIRARTLGTSLATNRNDNEESSDLEGFSTRALGRTLLRSPLLLGADQDSDGKSSNRPANFLGLGALGSVFGLNRTRSRGDSSEEREKNVFERNFEASRTQASIDKLEEEFGGFLGRLLGTIYRNADPIDESISSGIRRVLGAPPLSEKERRNRFRGLGLGPSSADGASSGGDVTTTSTPPPVKFRLTFDDIDPAPVRNTDLSLP